MIVARATTGLIRTTIAVLASVSLFLVNDLHAQTILFSDTFNRADNADIDASSTGMSGTAAPITYWESDPDAGDENLTQVTNNVLYMAYGANASLVGLQSHNFVDSQILADGGFRVSMDIQNLGIATDNERWCGFGVGVSSNELANMQLDYNSSAGPRGRTGSAYTGVADFFVCYTPNSGGDVQIFLQASASMVQQVDVNVGDLIGSSAQLRADFYPEGFGAADNVDVYVYLNSSLVIHTNFTWTDANENYLAVSARQGNGFIVDNLLVETVSAGSAPLVWVGDGSANEWNTNSLNWSNAISGSITKFSAGKNVTFNDSSVNTTVDISETVSPGLITLNNGVKNYTFAGAGTIAGTSSLVAIGNGVVTVGQSNAFSGGATLSSGRVRVGNDNALGTGTVTFSGGFLSSDGSTARTLPNAATITIATILGDTTDTGPITVAGPVDFNGAGRTVTTDSDVVFAGGASNGRVGSKRGSGTLTIKGLVEYNGASDVQDGTLIYDDATVTNSDRLIADAGGIGGTARLIITNGTSVTINTTVGNLRSGRTSSTGANYVDLAGLYSLPNADSGNGYLTLQSDAAHSEITFWPGGDFAARGVVKNASGSGPTVFKFNGGILRARNDNLSFFEGLSQTLVQAGGANIDDGGFTIAINQDLLDGGGNGGLKKLGTGTLLLNGNNTYRGLTVVSNGTLGGTGTLGSPVQVTSGATLAPGASVGTMTINSNLTLETGSSVFMEINKAAATNDLVTGLKDVAYAGTLTISNTSATPLAGGDSFTLFNASGARTGTFDGITILPPQTLEASFDPTNGAVTFAALPPGTDAFTVFGNSSNNILPVLANDNGSGLSLVGVANPPHGTAAINGTNILYSPATGYVGTDTFTYTNQNDLGSNAVLKVLVTVTTPPDLNDRYQVLRSSSSNLLEVLRNDGAGMTLMSVTPPANGTAFISGTNIIYTPASNYFGPDGFTYTIEDGLGASFNATVTMDVRKYPNFVFILADDQGWTGLSVQMDKNRPNSKSDYYQTPSMEKFAAQGMRFSAGYAPNPNCSPSRYADLTGKTCARLKMTDIIGRNNAATSGQFKLITPGKAVDAIQSSETTIPELLKSIPDAGYSAAHFGKWHMAGGGPDAHGFDADANDGATGNGPGDDGPEPINPDPKHTYTITDRALAYLDSRVTNGTAFYLQASHYAVHETTQTSQSSYNSYSGVPVGTWHTDRYYAGMTTDLDINVGRLLEKLDELGIRNSTYVIYQGDNGAPKSQSENYPLRGYKPEVWEGGTRTPTFVRGPGVLADAQCDTPVMGIDILPTIWEWATGSNSNLPSNVDGGSLVAAINNISHGSNSPAAIMRSGEFVHHSPHYVGPNAWPNDWQLNAKDMRPRSSLHEGDYKLVANYEPGTIELYDLKSDIGAQTNLSPAQLAIKWQLWVRLRDYLKLVQAQMPTLDPTYPGTTNGGFVLEGATGTLGDADSDGLDDGWEFRELLTYQFNGNDDTDQDGVSNAQELAQGTDPLLPNAYQINSITQIAPNQMQLTWNSTPGASFVVESSTNLVHWIPATTVTAGNVFSGSVTVEKTKPHEFIRVRRL